MDRSHYHVMFDKDVWKIQCDGENSESYLHKRDAVRDAVGLAHLDDKNGRQADVIVLCEDGMFRPKWLSCADAYPPPLVPDC